MSQCDEWSILLIDLLTIISFSSVDFPLCGAYAHTTLTTSSSKNDDKRHHSVIYTSYFNDFIIQFIFYLHTYPTIPFSISWHNNLYLLPCKTISLAPHPLHLTSCKQHKSTFLYHSSSHISNPFPFNVPIFQVPRHIFTL